MKTFGSGKFKYEVVEGWGDIPGTMEMDDIPGVHVDSKGDVFILTRGETPVIVFDKKGNYLRSWGKGKFIRAHGIYIGPEDEIYCADDGGHAVYKFTSEGELLMTIGDRGKPSDSGYKNKDFRTINKGAPPFNAPTNIAILQNKHIYISDGYGNSRIHKFKADGSLDFSWGEPGGKPGQFNLPHGVYIFDDKVYVADRENSRIQIFDTEGNFLEEWTNVIRPNNMFIDQEGYVYIAELGTRAGVYEWMAKPTANSPCSRISIFNLKGELLTRWGEPESYLPGNFYAAHDICVDSEGSIYVSEVAKTAMKGNIKENYFALTKFIRI